MYRMRYISISGSGDAEPAIGGKFVWSHRYQNMLIMVGFILFFRFATFYALERINYSTR